jgi:hypothetical protein
MDTDTKEKDRIKLNQSIQEMSRLLDLMHLGFKTANRKNSTIYSFMMELFEAFCLLRQNPSLRDKQELQDFLKESAQKVAGLSLHISNFQTDMESLFTLDPDYDPWPEACKRRSAFEALRELYQETQNSDLKEYLDPSDTNSDFNPRYR